MANGYSTSDLLKKALQKAGENTDGSSPYHQICLDHMNDVYLDVLSGSSLYNVDVGNPWSWARSRTRKTLILKAPYETGSISLTNGSAILTFSTAPGVSLGSFKDRFVKPDGRPEFYKILSHTAGAGTAVLETAFIGSTDSYVFKAIKLIYDISDDVLRLCAPITMYASSFVNGQSDVEGCDIDTLLMNYPMTNLRSGNPDRFAELFRSESEYLIQFSHYVLEDTKVDFDYIPFPDPLLDSKTSIPIIPYERRSVLSDGAAHLVLTDKNDPKSDLYFKKTTQGMTALQKADAKSKSQTASRNFGRLFPRTDRLTRTRNRLS